MTATCGSTLVEDAGAAAHEKARAESLVADARAAMKEEAPVERLRTLTAELQQLYDDKLRAVTIGDLKHATPVTLSEHDFASR